MERSYSKELKDKEKLSNRIIKILPHLIKALSNETAISYIRALLISQDFPLLHLEFPYSFSPRMKAEQLIDTVLNSDLKYLEVFVNALKGIEPVLYNYIAKKLQKSTTSSYKYEYAYTDDLLRENKELKIILKNMEFTYNEKFAELLTKYKDALSENVMLQRKVNDLKGELEVTQNKLRNYENLVGNIILKQDNPDLLGHDRTMPIKQQSSSNDSDSIDNDEINYTNKLPYPTETPSIKLSIPFQISKPNIHKTKSAIISDHSTESFKPKTVGWRFGDPDNSMNSIIMDALASDFRSLPANVAKLKHGHDYNSDSDLRQSRFSYGWSLDENDTNSLPRATSLIRTPSTPTNNSNHIKNERISAFKTKQSTIIENDHNIENK